VRKFICLSQLIPPYLKKEKSSTRTLENLKSGFFIFLKRSHWLVLCPANENLKGRGAQFIKIERKS